MANLQVNSPGYPQVQNTPGDFVLPSLIVSNFQRDVDAALAAQFGVARNDPFIGSPVQTNRLRAYVKIIISGMQAIGVVGAIDITGALEPYLLSVRVRDGRGGKSDYNAEIELDDRDARLPIPPREAKVDIEMGWFGEGSYNVFSGKIKDVEHGCARKQGGRRMWIHAAGVNHLSEAKAPAQDHEGEGATPGKQEGNPVNIMSTLSKFAGKVGHTFAMAPKFQSLTRDYISQNNESFYHFGHRIADEIGGLFRVTGGENAEINHPEQMARGDYPTVIAQWGYNLISWRVKPFASRPAWSGANQQFFDHLKGQWKFLAGKVGLAAPFDIANSVFALPRPAANSGNANQDTGGAGDVMAGEQGPGRIVINGEPRARGGGKVQLIGARPGVDGLYLIETAEHLYSREGYLTWLDVQIQATGGAGAVDATAYVAGGGFGGGFGGGSTVSTPPPVVTPPAQIGVGSLPPEALAGQPLAGASRAEILRQREAAIAAAAAAAAARAGTTPIGTPSPSPAVPPVSNFPGGAIGNPAGDLGF